MHLPCGLDGLNQAGANRTAFRRLKRWTGMATDRVVLQQQYRLTPPVRLRSPVRGVDNDGA